MKEQRRPLRKPSLKQRKAVAIMAENGGVASSAMIQAGYSPATAKTPHKLTRTEGFQYIMEELGITDKKLADTLNEGLSSTKTVVMGTKSEESFVDIQPDYQTRHKYLETGLRLKGLGKEAPSTNINFNSYAQKQRADYELS